LTVGGGAILTWASGIVMNENAGGITLLGMMLGTSFLGLLCAVWIAFLDRKEILAE
jgi:hypothetical protein